MSPLKVFISYKWADDAHNGWVEQLPGHLRDHKYADFRDDANYAHKLEELLADLLGRKTPARSSLADLTSKTTAPTGGAGTSEQTMRTIFTKEITYNGPSPEEIGRVGSSN